MFVKSLVDKAVEKIDAKNMEYTERLVTDYVNNILAAKERIAIAESDIKRYQQELAELQLPEPTKLDLT